jgi:transposase
MERRNFTREFKLAAVRLIKDRGVSYVQASEGLGVHMSQLRDWVKKFSDDPQQPFPGNGQMKPEQLEIQHQLGHFKNHRIHMQNVASFSASTFREIMRENVPVELALIREPECRVKPGEIRTAVNINSSVISFICSMSCVRIRTEDWRNQKLTNLPGFSSAILNTHSKANLIKSIA